MRKKIFTLLIAIACSTSGLLAQDEFVGEIRIFPLNFVPIGWMSCNGQLLQINQYATLFSILGTTYGGDGKTTFALPDLQGKVALNPGQGPGLSLRQLGEQGGQVSVTLLSTQIPNHNHPLIFTDAAATTNVPSSSVMPAFNATLDLPGITKPVKTYAVPGTVVPFAPQTLNVTGGNMAHNNMQPYLVLDYYICVSGIYPPRP